MYRRDVYYAMLRQCASIAYSYRSANRANRPVYDGNSICFLIIHPVKSLTDLFFFKMTIGQSTRITLEHFFLPAKFIVTNFFCQSTIVEQVIYLTGIFTMKIKNHLSQPLQLI